MSKDDRYVIYSFYLYFTHCSRVVHTGEDTRFCLLCPDLNERRVSSVRQNEQGDYIITVESTQGYAVCP